MHPCMFLSRTSCSWARKNVLKVTAVVISTLRYFQCLSFPVLHLFPACHPAETAQLHVKINTRQTRFWHLSQHSDEADVLLRKEIRKERTSGEACLWGPLPKTKGTKERLPCSRPHKGNCLAAPALAVSCLWGLPAKTSAAPLSNALSENLGYYTAGEIETKRNGGGSVPLWVLCKLHPITAQLPHTGIPRGNMQCNWMVRETPQPQPRAMAMLRSLVFMHVKEAVIIHVTHLDSALNFVWRLS